MESTDNSNAFKLIWMVEKSDENWTIHFDVFKNLESLFENVWTWIGSVVVVSSDKG